MEKILGLINSFEERNNLSVSMVIHSDGSGHIMEFWDNEEIFSFDNMHDFEHKASSINLKKDEKGLSLSPIEIIKDEPTQ